MLGQSTDIFRPRRRLLEILVVTHRVLIVPPKRRRITVPIRILAVVVFIPFRSASVAQL